MDLNGQELGIAESAIREAEQAQRQSIRRVDAATAAVERYAGQALYGVEVSASTPFRTELSTFGVEEWWVYHVLSFRCFRGKEILWVWMFFGKSFAECEGKAPFRGYPLRRTSPSDRVAALASIRELLEKGAGVARTTKASRLPDLDQ